MSHEHAKDSPSASHSTVLPTRRTARERTVQHLTRTDLLTAPPRITRPTHVVGRIESSGLGRPSYVELDGAEGLIPDALVLEYGPADTEQARSARVWIRSAKAGSAPLYLLSSDSSSSGYVSA
ncbi:hypothetical protein [uncultured Microbacterium sp.]|uniref:hypothetical protein n=1 Tax=uncultured Microbacterium sp. TaxID=191216 RepID=UPI0028D7F4FE|nr:hypothetical protein [uncultured Microbacterium sp.]